MSTHPRLRAVPPPDSEPGDSAHSALPGESRGASDTEGERLERLVERARDGDTQAWARLYQSCFDRLYRRVRFLTGDAETAEELTQETFVRAFTNMQKFDGRSSFPTWLSAVALNVVRNYWRKNKSTAKAHAKLEVVHAVQAGTTTPDADLLRRQRERALYAALDRIPEMLREVFVLKEIQGLTRHEVAQQLEITPNNVSVRANRARARVRQELERMGALEPRPGGGA